jgi:segregation and condensation protein A
MTAGFQLSLPGFDGPVEELPAVVSARQLALDEIPLASIPSQFLAAAGGSDKIDLDLAGEVLAATARLMLMKSVQLLAQPQTDEEDERVEGPRERDPALAGPTRALSERQGSRSYASVGRIDSVPRLSGTRPVRSLTQAWRAVIAREVDGPAHAAVPAFVRLEAAISRIIARVGHHAGTSFRKVLGRATREDAVMHFLATLELLRRGEVEAEQDELFGDIRLERANVDRERADRAG